MSSDSRLNLFRTVGLILVAVVGLFAINRILSRRAQQAVNAVAPANRTAAPDFTVSTLAGGTWSLAAQRGHVVVVNFFATWCPPCRAETPDLVKLAADYGPKGVSFIALSMDQDGPDVVRPFVKKYGMEYPVAMAQPGSAIAADITGIPVTKIIDRHGRIAREYVGMISADQVKADLDSLLAEK